MTHSKYNRCGPNVSKTHRYTFRLNDEQNARFLSMLERSGNRNKSRFIQARLFGTPFKVIKIDKSRQDFYMRLTNILAQIRAIGVNFNQVTRSVHTNFNVRRAIALLSRLEGYSAELCELERQVIELTEGFRKWSEE